MVPDKKWLVHKTWLVYKKYLAGGGKWYQRPNCPARQAAATIRRESAVSDDACRPIAAGRLRRLDVDDPMHVLLFDIDGTLVDAGGAGQAAMEQAVARVFGETRPVTGIPTAGRTDRAIGRDLFDYYSIAATEANWSRYLSSYFELLPDSLRLRNGKVLPGVTALIERLSASDGVFLGLLTGNFAEGARLKLEHFGLHHHFRAGGFGDDHLHRDDVARQAFATVREHLPDVRPDQIWVVGDTPADVQCGRAIGANVLAVATGIYRAEELAPCEPDVLLNDLSAPEEWLARLGLESSVGG
jgi:phosphoglycolate phosphatase